MAYRGAARMAKGTYLQGCGATPQRNTLPGKVFSQRFMQIGCFVSCRFNLRLRNESVSVSNLEITELIF